MRSVQLNLLIRRVWVYDKKLNLHLPFLFPQNCFERFLFTVSMQMYHFELMQNPRHATVQLLDTNRPILFKL